MKKLFIQFDILLALSLTILGILSFYPGAMSGDSIDQLKQSLNPGEVGNWFPPVMVYMWRTLNTVTEGPQSMLIFHFSLYFLAIFGFARFFINTILKRLIYIFGVGLFPPIFFLIGVIWKDVSLLIGVANAILFLLVYERNKKVFFLFLSILFFLYAIMVRYNAIICAIPYSYYFATIVLKRGIRFRRPIILMLVVVMTVVFTLSSNFASNYNIRDEWKTHNFENAVFIWDLWGMSIEVGKNIVPAYVFNNAGKDLDIETMKKHYNPETNNIIYLMQYITNKRFSKEFPNKKFKKDFIRLILDHPMAYLTVRIRLTWYMLGGRNPILPFLFKIKHFPKNHYLHEYSKNLEFRQPKIINYFHNFAKFLIDKTFFYKVWIYLFLSIIQIIYFTKYKPEMSRQFIFILSIGLIYWFPYPIISPATDFRFSNLTIFCSILTFPFFIKNLFSYLLRKDY